MSPPLPVFARRPREARKRAEITQEELAVAAGIDEFSASARISQYETGKHLPKFEIAVNLANAVGVPVEFFYSVDDRTARMLLAWKKLSAEQKEIALVQMESLG